MACFVLCITATKLILTNMCAAQHVSMHLLCPPSYVNPGLRVLATYISSVHAGHDAVQKVTLIPRGQARGLTWFIPGEDPTLISKQQIFARIVGALGGRAAEQVIFGDAEVTTGASSDLQQVSASSCTLRLILCAIVG